MEVSKICISRKVLRECYTADRANDLALRLLYPLALPIIEQVLELVLSLGRLPEGVLVIVHAVSSALVEAGRALGDCK